MSLKKIIRKNIEDNAVTEPKLANEAVTAEKLSTDFVTGLTELSEQAANDDVLLIYDTSAGALKKVAKSNTTDLESPVVSSVSPTSVVSDAGTTTFTITGTGFTAGSNARLIGSNGKKIDFTTVTRNSTTQITATINVTTDLLEAETPYSVQVIGGNGIADLLTDQIDIDQYPVFVTASGSLGSSRYDMAGIEVNATDPDSAAPVTFELQSGSLPPGISITNTSANGGTATFTGNITAQASDTVFNFVLRAVDAASNTSSRSFSFTALGPSSQSFTSSGTFSVPTGATSVDVLVVAGGGSGGGNATGGAGAGGLIFMPSYPVTPSGTLTVTVGEGGPAGDTPAARSLGQDSSFGSPGDPGLGQGGVLTAKGGGWGGSKDGGSGAGDNGFSPAAGSATQPTQPGNSGAYGFGNPGGNGNYTGQSVGGGPYTGGGGGGAGAAGQNSTVSGSGGGNAGNGGDGKAYTIADGTTPVYYAGGAGGNSTSSGAGNGGLGGGGQGGDEVGQCGTAGQANKGGGGGGKQNSPSANAGGKGIVIVRY